MSMQSGGYREGQQHPFREHQCVPTAKLGKNWVATKGPDIRGWDVLDQEGKKVGKIDDVLVDTATGQAELAIVSVGGVLGVGGRKTLVPIDELNINASQEHVMLPVREQILLNNAPEYDENEVDFVRFHEFWRQRPAA